MTKPEKILNDIYIWLMLGVFPLFVTSGGYTNITNTKYIFFAVATVSFGLAKMICKLICRPVQFKFTFTTWAVLAFLLAVIISAVCSDYPLRVIMGTGRDEGLPTLFLYVLVFLCASGIPYRRLHALPLALSSAVFCAIGIIQILDKNPLSLYPAQYYYYAAQDIYTARFLSTIGNEGIACAFMCIAVPFFFAFFVTSKKKISAAVLPVMSVMFFLLLYTNVLGGMIGCVCTVALACVMLFTSSQRLGRILIALSCLTLAFAGKYLLVPHYSYPDLRFEIKADIIFIFILIGAVVFAVLSLICCLCPFRVNISRTRGIIFLLLVTVLLLALLFVLTSNAADGFVFELKEILNGNISEEFGSNRVRIWSRSLELFLEKPVLGSGPNTIFQRMNITFERFSPLKNDYVRTSVDNAHNEPLNLLVNVGVLGFLPFALAIFSVYRKNKHPKPCIYALTGYIVQSMFLFSICITAPYFWLMLGLCNTKNE